LICEDCPTGADCDEAGLTWDRVKSASGYWRSNGSLEFMRCVEPNHCVGGELADQCMTARTGPLCALCEPGYEGSTYDMCVKCENRQTSIGLVVLFCVLLVVVIGLLYYTALSDQFTSVQLEEFTYTYSTRSSIASRRSVLQGEEVSPEDTSISPEQQQPDSPRPPSSPPLGAVYYKNLANSRTDVLQAQRDSENSPSASMPGAPSGGGAGYKLDGGSLIKTRNKILTMTLDDFMFDLGLQMQGREIVSSSKYARLSAVYNLKIILGFLQIATTLRYLPSIFWPSMFRAFLSAFDFVNLALIPWNSVGCVVPIDYYIKMVGMIIIPAGVIAVLSCLFLIPLYAFDRADFGDDDHSKLRRKKYRLLFYKAIIFTLFLIYPAVSRQVISFFNCETINGKSFLVADFHLECYTNRWYQYATAAGVGIVVYPVGIPLLFLGLLCRNRMNLRRPGIMVSLGFLYESYNANVWWFELVDMGYKLIMTSLLVFIPSNLQLGCALVVCLGYCCAITLLKPYVRSRNEVLAFLVQVEILLFLLAAYTNQNNVIVANFEDVLLSLLLIGMFCLVLCLFGFYLWVAFKKLIAKKIMSTRQKWAKDSAAAYTAKQEQEISQVQS